MLSKTLATAGLLAGFAISAVTAAVPTIKVVGSKFFYENGTQYFLKGMLFVFNSKLHTNSLQELRTN